jgi:hypothetical protein
MTKKILTYFFCLNLLGFGLSSISHAGLIGTQTLVEAEQRQQDVASVEAFLASEQIHEQMVRLGANPDEISGRLAALTGEELRVLQAQIESLPAGGDALAVIGVVFLVLLILELVGVTNIFSKI